MSIYIVEVNQKKEKEKKEKKRKKKGKKKKKKMQWGQHCRFAALINKVYVA